MRSLTFGLPFGATTVSFGNVPHLEVLMDRAHFSPVRWDGRDVREGRPAVFVGEGR